MRESESEWRVVSRRKYNRREEPITNFFVAGIPEGVSSLDLREAAKRFGKIADAFIPKKRRFNKEIFGFLRFKNVQRVDELLENLNSMVFRESKVRVNLSTCPRGDWVSPLPANRGSVVPVEGGRVPIREVEVRPPEKSYRSLLLGDKMTGYPPGNIVLLNSDPIPEMELLFNRSIVACLESSVDLVNIKITLADLGFKRVDVKYVGGLHVLLTFSSNSEAGDCLSVIQGSDGFESVAIWDGGLISHDRIVGLRMVGLPLHLRCNRNYNKIGEAFGKMIWPSNFSWCVEDVSTGWCHVLSKDFKKIDSSINVVSGGMSFSVSVTEDITTWIPAFDEEEVAPSVSVGEDSVVGSGRKEAADGKELEESNLNSPEEGEFRSPVLPIDFLQEVQSAKGGAELGEQSSAIGRGTSHSLEEGSFTNVDHDIFSSQFVGSVGTAQEVPFEGSLNQNNGVLHVRAHESAGPSLSHAIPGSSSFLYSGPKEVEVCPIASDPLPLGRKKRRNVNRRINAFSNQRRLLKGGGKSLIWGSIASVLSRNEQKHLRVVSALIETGLLSSDEGSDGQDDSEVSCSVDQEMSISLQIGELVGVPMVGFEKQLKSVIIAEGEGDESVPL
ncbi:hypothetical protein SSX86_031114 [Deinandra increscens subsp. villosa]|uniref:RRM domain-containing protein n=1 Tax=Deinandra increscens subsp. villosa TaxID=3103831 RepID=A0AAP0GIK1_9ASTR